jgi:hypothetical protein
MAEHKTGNIEYHRGWQIEKNGSPGSLHNKFSNDKIIHGIDSSLNIGMAETQDMNKDFEKIYESTHKMEEWIDQDHGMFGPKQIIMKSFMTEKDWWEENPKVYNAVFNFFTGRDAPDLEDL